MIKFYYKGVKNEKTVVLDESRRGAVGVVVNPSPKEIEEITAKYNLDDGLLADALDPYEFPRIETDEYKYIFVKIPVRKNKSVSLETLLIALGDEISFFISQSDLLCLDRLRKEGINTTQKSKLVLQLLSYINEDYEKHIHEINKKVSALSKFETEISNSDIAKLVEYESTLNNFLSALVPTNLILERLLQHKTLPLFEEDKELMEDLLLGNKQLIEISKATLKYIVNIRESYSTILSNNLNKTMKLLTSITVILTIPTIISSFYGMNVRLPFDNHPYASYGILGFTLVTCIALLIYFIKRKLL
jgi:magnesium transporter